MTDIIVKETIFRILGGFSVWGHLFKVLMDYYCTCVLVNFHSKNYDSYLLKFENFM